MTISDTQNSDTSPQVLQTFALLQITAESFLNNTSPDTAAAPPTGSLPFELQAEWLKNGNNHSSRMTDQQADDFKNDWKVVSHQSNTATGLSATLFQLKPGRAETSKGTFEGQFVVSFRSTEFIEDAARDNQETNTLEIKDNGWAFGQLGDAEKWWNSVQSVIGTSKVDVTGYSLGGHLATAFAA
jgi:hypothetical protein